MKHEQDAALGVRQRRFLDEYLIDCNATRAAVAAGYTKRTAAQAGWEVLRNPKVAAELSRRQILLAARYEVTAQNVVSELAKIGFASIADFYKRGSGGRLELNFEALSDPMKASALSQIEVQIGNDGGQTVKIKLADKRAALNDLGRHLGLFKDRSEITVSPQTDHQLPSVRELALASLALLSAAANDRTPTAIQLEAGEANEDNFDLED